MENTSIRSRFSLSTTNLTNPIAESTCLNGSSTNKGAKFNWGEGSIISRSRNNTQITNKTASNSKNFNATPSKVTMSPTSRIDARTYVDIHSNGLASRIVKYHDNSTRLNRSLSMGNLYNKPGQFPLVHLRKNEQQYKAKKCKNLSMTKIAAPEKSVFHGNTLSSILRSGSIVGLQKTDEEISRENRPILHPPPTENEMAPTRSVLEVLKEISRKRINSDEIDGTDLIKKPCKELEFDTNSYNGQKVQSKRQREISSPVSSIQLSPEQQVVKKRMCNYNNDILSSLSSSILSFNKKKTHELQSQRQTVSELTTCNSSISNCFENGPSRNGKQRCQESFDLENLVHSTKYTPITPLPSTPSTQSTVNSDALNKGLNVQVTRRASEPVITNTKPRLTLFNKDYDEAPSYLRNDATEPKDDGGLSGIQFVKPKKSSSLSSDGTLLMEKTKQSKLALMLKGLKGELDEEDEVDAPPKVEPPKRADASVNAVATPIINSSSSQVSIPFGTTTTAATTVISTSNTSTKPISSSSTTSGMKTDLQTSVLPTPVSVSINSNSLNSFQINPISASTSKAAPPTIVTTAVSSISLSTTTTLTSAATSVNSIGLFSFGLNKPPQPESSSSQNTTSNSKTTVPQLTTTTSAPGKIVPTLPITTTTTKLFSFGLSTTQVPTSTSTSVAPSFNFAAPNNSLSTTSSMQANTISSAFVSIQPSAPKTTEAPPPMFGQTSTTVQPTFSFGSLAASSANPQMKTTSPALTTNAPTFNFGASKNSSTLSMTPAPENANTSPSIGSFMNPVPSVSMPQLNSTIPSATITGGFSFSGSSSSEATKPLFGSMVSSTSTALNSNGKFSFSANKTPTTQANTPGTSPFNFGSSVAPSVSTTNSAQPPAFGNITPVKPSNSFSFGTPVPSTPVKPSFSFSAGNKPVIPVTTTNNSVGGFSFNPPHAASSFAAPDPSKNMFSNTAATLAPTKPVFAFGSATSNTPNKPAIFGASEVKTTNPFGASTTTTAQSSPFTFDSSTSTLANQGTSTLPSSNIFGAASNTPSNGLGVPTSSSSSIFGAPSAAVAPIQQSSTFAFGSGSSITTAESNKPSGGFVFGSSSSIGSNASKPTTELNKTFVFGDASTTISSAPLVTQNLFGGNSTNTSNATVGATENKVFSFGAVGAGTAGNSNNTFGGNRQMVNQSPVFNFGASGANTQPPAQNGNLFAPQSAGAQNTLMPLDRPTRKAVRRLHKT